MYNLFRTPEDLPGNVGPYSWCDPFGKKRYRLNTHYLRELVRYAEEGNELRTHSDVPQRIRDQLYAEDQQRLKGHQRSTSAPAANFPPINITNVLPGHTPPLGSSPALTPVPDMSQLPLTITRLDIPGNRDELVEEYCEWQQGQVKADDQKQEYRKACDYLIEHTIDLEEACQNPDVARRLQDVAKVKRGAAWRVVGDEYDSLEEELQRS